MVLSCGGGGSVVSNKVIKGEGGLQKVVNFPFHYSFQKCNKNIQSNKVEVAISI